MLNITPLGPEAKERRAASVARTGYASPGPARMHIHACPTALSTLGSRGWGLEAGGLKARATDFEAGSILIRLGSLEAGV